MTCETHPTTHSDELTGDPRAFTLIELLVVVSVIALLVAILLPALRKAREQGKQAVCLANLKGIATAGVTYTYGDPQEQCIPVHPLTGRVRADVGAYDWGGKAGRGDSVGGQDPLASMWGTAQGRGPGTRPLNNILLKGGVPDHRDDPGPNQVNWTNDANMDFPIMRCPSDRGFSGFHLKTFRDSQLSSFDHYGTGYSSNAILGISGHIYGEPRVWTISPFLRPVSRVPAPADTIQYMENCGRFAWYFKEPDPCMVALAHGLTTDGERIEGWHKKPFQFSASFLDGHAGVAKMKGRIIPPPHQAQYPAGASHYAWRCAIIRGNGWKLDCFPSFPIVTDIAPEKLTIVPEIGL